MFANNTPCKKRKIVETITTTTITSLAHLQEHVRDELTGAVFDAQDDMINRMFPVDDTLVDEIYSSMVEGGLYVEQDASAIGNNHTPSGHWKDIPIYVNLENELYPGFVKVANAIADRCRSPQMLIHWIDSHSKSPKSSVCPTNELKPDLTALVLPKATHEDITLRGPRNKKLPLWWRRIQVPLEVKKARSHQAIVQLMSYIRLIFREQADRRFVLGFVLALQNLVVHVADRSGVLRSAPINIHKTPKTFIRVMAGLSLLPPALLGWDPTMKILKNPEESVKDFVCQHSWETDQVNCPGRDRAYDEKWVVEMPVKNSDGKEGRVKFVLFNALSLLRAGVIRGRGTRIWKAWRMDDMHLPSVKRHVYVYKDTWKDDRRQTEGELFERVGNCEGLAKMVSHELVKIDGKVDNTLTLVRQNVQHEGGGLDMRRPPGHDLVVESHEAFNTPAYVVWNDVLYPAATESELIPRGRTHTRLVIKDFGWPLRRFTSLLELVRVLKNVVDGHRNLLDNGVLHRDISQGNIIIAQDSADITNNTNKRRDSEAPDNQDRSKHPPKHRSTYGQLIDLDYAKDINDENCPITDEPRSCTWPFVSPEIIRNRAIFPDTSDDITGFIPTHSHQHDLESLFWVVCWLAMNRGGPGVARELLCSNENSQHEISLVVGCIPKLRRTVHLLFNHLDGDKLVSTKVEYFNNPKMFEIDVLKFFAPYFAPIEPLVKSLYSILRQAYETRKFNTLHVDFRKELADMEKKLEKDPHGYLLRQGPYLPTSRFRNFVNETEGNEILRRKIFWGGWDIEMEDTKEKTVSEDFDSDGNDREQKKRRISTE